MHRHTAIYLQYPEKESQRGYSKKKNCFHTNLEKDHFCVCVLISVCVCIGDVIFLTW